MPVPALVFDVFGTLVDWRTGIAQAFASSRLDGDPSELADDWRKRYVPILAEVNEQKRPWGNFDELHFVTLDDLLRDRGLEASDDTRRRLVAAWHALDPWPDVRDGLEQLRGSHVLATLSNGHVAMLVDLARHGDLRFDCVLSAELVRAYKPDPAVYLMGATLLTLDPAEVMLVAAHPWDLKGARSAGLRSALVRRPLEYGPGSPERDDPEADHVVDDLQELAARLRA